MARSFLVGVVVGGVMVWLFRDEIRHYLSERTRGVRSRAAEKLEAIEQSTAEALDSAKAQIGATLRAGQEAVRPDGPFS